MKERIIEMIQFNNELSKARFLIKIAYFIIYNELNGKEDDRKSLFNSFDRIK